MIGVPQTFRYAIVSGICLLLCLTLIPLFSSFGLHYALATFVAFCLIAIIGFFLHCFWTFGVERRFSSFARYVSAMALNLPLTILLIGIGHDFAGLSVAVSTSIASAMLIVWNYLAVRWAVMQQMPGARQ